MGIDLPPRSFQVTRQDLAAYAEASGDHNPIHQDEEVALSVGLPGVIAHGMFTMALAARYVEEYAGPGRVVAFGAKFTKPVVVPYEGGADIVVEGVVKSVDTETKRATVELTASSGGEKVLGRAVAVVRLD